MNDMLKDPCAPHPDCCALPAEFVRLRYFFGQRLGVVDLTDEQRYVVGKQRFHNSRAHGPGVLCGLRAERYVFPAGADPAAPVTVLRVSRGAAIDGCGREVVVGWDHCVDVAAWFRKHVDENEDLALWRTGDVPPEDRRLWVALCYRECESDPAVAPRDPCGCDTGGCEFSRVRESFLLQLLTESELERCLQSRHAGPSFSGLELAGGVSTASIDAQLAAAAARDCAELSADACLCLASVLVELDPTGEQVVDLGAVDNAIDQRLTLLSTSDLQAWSTSLLAALGPEAAPGPAPRLGALRFAGVDDVSGTLSLPIALVDDGMGPIALAGDPVPGLSFAVHRFADDGTWTDLTPLPADIVYFAAPEPRIDLPWSAGLTDGGRYRLVVEVSAEPPPVDTRMRPLIPRRYVRHFRLQTNASSVLELSPSLYDA